MTAQDKILHVANKLGLTSLQNMQGSTGAVYDVDIDLAGQIFSNAARHQNPSVTNINENQFEVNEALLVETIAFYVYNGEEEGDFAANFQRLYGSNAVITFDLIIGNKRVMKDTPIFGAGSPYTFANIGSTEELVLAPDSFGIVALPRHQIFMEGAGVLIPPQVQWSVQYNVGNIINGEPIEIRPDAFIGCYLFGTKVLLNFNTSI